MAHTREVADAVRLYVRAVALQQGERYRSAILFGSHARGEARAESDVDVAVLLDGKRGDIFDKKLELAELAYDLLLETGILIQPLPIWRDEWECPALHRNPQLIENIRREGQTI